jgi:predicted secreted protein
MNRLVGLEGGDPIFRQRLIDRFNAGFQAAQTDYPVCNGQSRIAAQSSAARGKTLSETLVGESNFGSVR